MHPLGCFGSILAFDAKAERCKVCIASRDCKKAIDKIRPSVLKHLDKFPSVSGGTMGDHWRTSGEMKAKRQHQQAVAQQIVIGQVYDGDKLDALRKAISKDANKLLTTAIEDRIDVFNDPIDKLQYLSRQVGIFFKIISIGPRPQKDIEKAIVILCSMTPKTAASHVKKIKCLFLNAGRIVEKDGKIQLA